MPELPDIVVYIENLESRFQGSTLGRIRILNPFVLRTAIPPISSAEGRRVLGPRRLGKRIVYADNETNYCARCQTGGRILADRVLRGCSRRAGRAALTTSTESCDFLPLPVWNERKHIEIPV